MVYEKERISSIDKPDSKLKSTASEPKTNQQPRGGAYIVKQINHPYSHKIIPVRNLIEEDYTQKEIRRIDIIDINT